MNLGFMLAKERTDLVIIFFSDPLFFTRRK